MPVPLHEVRVALERLPETERVRLRACHAIVVEPCRTAEERRGSEAEVLAAATFQPGDPRATSFAPTQRLCTVLAITRNLKR